MAMCPLLRKECIQNQCAWWLRYGDYDDSQEQDEYGLCAVALLPELLAVVKVAVDDIGNKVNDIEYIEEFGRPLP